MTQFSSKSATEVLEEITDAFYALDRHWRLTYVNRRAETYFGLDQRRMLGQVLWDLFPVTRGSIFETRFAEAVQQRRPVSFEARSPLFDRWVSVYAAPHDDGLSVFFRDITDRKRTELRNQFLVALDDAVRPLADPQEITQAAARLLGEHLGVDRCAYAEVEPDEDTMNLTGNYTRDESVRSIVGRLKFSDFGAEVLRLMREDKPYVVCDVDTHTPPVGDPAAYRATQIQAVICVPLHKQGRFAAGMAVHTVTPRAWQTDEVELVRAVAARCWESIERARVARALRESREQLETVVKGANVGVWYCPLPFDRLIWDDKVKEHFHLPPDAEVTIDTFYARLHPDDRERTRETIDASIRERRSYDIHYRTVSADGQQVKWVRASGRGFYDAEGNPTRFDGITIDATAQVRAEVALRQSEERLRLAVAIAEMGTFEIDLRTDAVVVNEPGRVIYGWGPEEELTFSKVQSHFHPDDRERVMAAVGAALDAEGPGEFEVTQRIIRTDGEERSIRVRGRAVWDAGVDTGPVRCVGTYIDITERQRAEDERDRLLESERAARNEAERASRMKDEFLATLSHELRTPLNAIYGWSQMLLRTGGELPANVRQGLATIERNARAQTQIIEDLLDMSRIISGKVRLDVQRVDLAPVIEAAVETVRHAADAKGVRLQVVLDPGGGPVSGDPQRLQQVLWNLLSNAIKFTPRGGRVQVLLERVNSHLEVSVIDTGEGIDADFLPHVFDRFRQADASTTRQHGGLGLGLAIAKHLVELHGGSIRVKSPGVGHGSTFTISLPVPVLHRDARGSVEPREPAAGEARHSMPEVKANLAGVNVLVVDDEPDARELVRRLLEERGARVSTASSATEALHRLQAERPDVLVSDVGMPGEDGYSLLKRVRALGPGRGGDVPAVALTAYARAEDRVRSVLAGFQMHIAKPVEPAELLATVANLAGRT